MSSVSIRLCTHGAPALCLSRTLESGLHMMGQITLRSSLPLEQAWIKEEDEAHDGYGLDTRKNKAWERNPICY